jgi:murein tripeptide amidase MpaA
MRASVAFAITCSLSIASFAADGITVSSDFEGGGIGKVEHVSANHLRCAVEGEADQDQRNRQTSWFYFRLDGVQGKELTIELTDLAGEYNFRPNRGVYMLPVFSYDDKTWQHLDQADYDAEVAKVTVRFTPEADRVWLARIAPYTTQHLDRLLNDLRKHPHLTESSVGQTVEGRPMRLLTITNPQVADTDKQVIWLMARQHSWETGTSWVCEGALRFLLSDDPAAKRIRDRFIFKVFPMADPDGVFRGGVRFNLHGYDLNRNWDTVDARLMPEIFAQRKAVLEWVDGGHRIDLFLTLHNTESADYIRGPAAAQPLAERFWKLLVDGTAFYSPNPPDSDPPAVRTPQAKGRMTAAGALFAERQIPAFLMEQMVNSSTKLGRAPTVEDRLKFGAQLAQIMCAAVEPTR